MWWRPPPPTRRFAVRPIAVGEDLLSWGLPFGEAVRPIAPGQYCCNASIIESLAARHVDFALPEHGNFVDKIRRFDLAADDGKVDVVEQVWPLGSPPPPTHTLPLVFAYGA